MIYLDNNATTSLDPQVWKAIEEIYCGPPLNPSSIHQFGQKAKGYLQSSLNQIAKYFQVSPGELILTSGATEAINLLIQGFSQKGHIVCSSLEHPAALQALTKMEAGGRAVTYLSPHPFKGAITLSQIEEAVREDTRLLIFMAANNETGVKTSIEDIADFALRRNLFLIVDGVAALGKDEWKMHPGISGMCFSSHKIHGPQGVGLCIVRNHYPLSPQIVGGAQQKGRRGGTENVAGVVGFAKALSLIDSQAISRMNQLRNQFEERICQCLPDVLIHGKEEPRVCNVSNIAFLGIEGESLLIQLDLAGVLASHGSACTSGGLLPSRVLLQMGLPKEMAQASLRFSISRFTTEVEIGQAAEIIINSVINLRKLYHGK